MVTSPKKPSLAAWLLACPLLLAAAVFVLPRFNQLYGTSAERYMLLVLMALPLVGMVGIFRRKDCTLLVRLLLSACCLFPCVVLALFAVVFIGCSWAGACL